MLLDGRLAHQQPCSVGVLLPFSPERPRSRRNPGCEYDIGRDCKYWQSIICCEGVLLSHEVRPNGRGPGDQNLLLARYGKAVGYAIGSLTLGWQAVGDHEPSPPHLVIPEDTLMPYPFTPPGQPRSPAEEKLARVCIHPNEVRNFVGDLLFGNPLQFTR